MVNDINKILSDVGYKETELIDNENFQEKMGYKVNIRIKNFCDICKEDIKIKDGTAIIDFNKLSEFDYKLSDQLLENPNEILKQLKDNLKVSKIKILNSPEEIKEKKSSFILDQSKLPQRINHALGKIKINGEYFRYKGIVVDEEIEKQGGMIKQIKKVPAIVLESGEILSDNTKPKGVNFEFDSIMTLKNNRWSLNSIKDFVNGKLNPEDYSFKKVFKKFKQFYDLSMVYEENEVYSFKSLRDMKSYFWDINDKFLIIKKEGISGTAKSKSMKIGANLSFNGKKFLCPTPANFFRYRHHNKATLFIEEAEKLFDTSKKQNIGDSELIEYLNGSYEKGNVVPRQNDKNINQTDEFDPAGETEIGSINPLRGALEKRSIPLQMIKAPKKDSRGNVEVPPEIDPEYSRARDMMYICSLLNYKEFEKALGEVKNNYGLQNREWILAKPYVALASCISPELEKQIGEFIARKFTIRDDSFDSESWERIMADVLLEIFSEREETQFISTNHIKSRFLFKLGGDYNKISTHKISKLINTLGFSDYKTRDTTGTERGYEINFWKLSEILIRNDWIIKEELLKKVSELSEVSSKCHITDDKINKWLSDTFLTLDTSNKKEEEISDTIINKEINIKPLIDNKCQTIPFETDTSDTLTLYGGVGVDDKISKFTPEQIKQAGYTKEELEEAIEDEK